MNFNAANQVTGTGNSPNSYVYDIAGNLHNDGVNTYSYDAEGDLTGVVSGGNTTTYIYDTANRRIRTQGSGSPVEVVFDESGKRLSTWSSGSLTEANIYWDGRAIGYRTGGATHFEHQDWLGTERMRTTAAGSVEGSYSSLPFGDSYSASGADTDQYHFAGLDNDPESGTQHAQFRQYSSMQGRWLSPDPSSASYDSSNPQSLNRYNYALNNPLGMIDPSGLDPCGNGGQVDAFRNSNATAHDDSQPCFGDPTGGGSANQGADGCPPGVDACVSATDCPADACVSADPLPVGGPCADPENVCVTGDQLPSLTLTNYNLGTGHGAPSNPLNPCSGANPANLNYTAANGQQHIMQNHMAGGRGPGTYSGDWTAIQLLNQATLTMGTLDPSQAARDLRQNTYTLQWTAPPMFWPLSLIFTNNIGWSSPGQPTPTNRLVVTTNCSTVVTSYPIP